jgi:putative SOS response-associated peptidase YedK
LTGCSFLTTEANATIAPIHAKAMPAILTTPAEFDCWLEPDTLDALALQRPLPHDALKVVAKGEKEDGVAAALLSRSRVRKLADCEFRNLSGYPRGWR